MLTFEDALFYAGGEYAEARLVPYMKTLIGASGDFDGTITAVVALAAEVKPLPEPFRDGLIDTVFRAMEKLEDEYYD